MMSMVIEIIEKSSINNRFYQNNVNTVVFQEFRINLSHINLYYW